MVTVIEIIPQIPIRNRVPFTTIEWWPKDDEGWGDAE